MPAELVTRHGSLALPVFCPDATRAVVRTVGADDLRRCGVQGLVVNTLHLTQTPGVGLIKSQGGVHAFMGWDRPLISDSGGFQAMSLIRQNPRYGAASDAGIAYTNADAPARKKLKLTPEKCIQIQFDLGSDIMVVPRRLPARRCQSGPGRGICAPDRLVGPPLQAGIRATDG